MKFFRLSYVILAIYGLLSCNQPVQTSTPWKLWYEKPASKWVEALPLGNGRLGAMVFGGTEKEQIQFNEETLWTGEPRDYANVGSAQYLEEIRTLLAKGKQSDAEKLAMEKFMSNPLRQEAFQPFGDLRISFPGHDSVTSYRRELDLSTAMVTVSYSKNDIDYQRTYFVSQPDQVLAAGFSASKRKSLNFSVALSADHLQSSSEVLNGNELSLRVKVTNDAMEGFALLKVFQEGGELAVENNEIKVSGASHAWVLLTAATNFENPKSLTADPVQKCREWMANFPKGMNFTSLENRHLAEYQPYFNRFDLHLGNKAKDSVSTDQRILDYQTEADLQLAALYVQYGRYLMIASSRPGTYPANLQGIWNKDLEPAWGSKYTVNINTEMNYWPVEMLNLSEFHQPLFKMLEEVVPSGESVAREHYNLPGWVLHHNTDLWRGAAPINASNHGIWPTGGAWLCHHIWEHFLFTRDTAFLKAKFPILAGSARFFAGFLIKDEKTGWLISSPSNSPENGGLVAGPTMDHAIIRSLFKIVAEASDITGEEVELATRVKEMIPEIAPYQIGKSGQLQEWLEDKDDPNNKHRHVSHLWTIHPGKEINWKESPELMEAAKQSLIFRGDEGTGWSLAWKINFWARLRDGNHAYEMVKKLFRPVQFEGIEYRGGGGSYPNLFDAHPPFQIDGNFGGAAGIMEMLIQSHMDEVELLPALPSELPSGWVKGVRARGGFEIDFAWENGIITRVSVLSLAGQPLRLRIGEKVFETATRKGERVQVPSE